MRVMNSQGRTVGIPVREMLALFHASFLAPWGRRFALFRPLSNIIVRKEDMGACKKYSYK